jgi:hypothetical protein
MSNPSLPNVQERSGEVLDISVHRHQLPDSQIPPPFHRQGAKLPINALISRVLQRHSSVWRRPSGIPDRSAPDADGVLLANMQRTRSGGTNTLEVLATQHCYPLSFGAFHIPRDLSQALPSQPHNSLKTTTTPISS